MKNAYAHSVVLHSDWFAHGEKLVNCIYIIFLQVVAELSKSVEPTEKIHPVAGPNADNNHPNMFPPSPDAQTKANICRLRKERGSKYSNEIPRIPRAEWCSLE